MPDWLFFKEVFSALLNAPSDMSAFVAVFGINIRQCCAFGIFHDTIDKFHLLFRQKLKVEVILLTSKVFDCLEPGGE